MNLLDLLQSDGFHFKKVADTRGGEWAGPCPFCGGKDRCRVWPAHRGGRFWCRGCGKTGDAVQYLREAKGISYDQACERLWISGHTEQCGPLKPKFTPRETSLPPEIWLKKAKPFLNDAARYLWQDSGTKARTFLHGRGLTDQTLQRARLGWNGNDTYHYRETWGLPVELKDNGKVRRLWLPTGIVIPCFDDDRLVRLRIRRSEPSGPRYVLIPGSSMMPMLWLPDDQTDSGDRPAVVILESELDGLLVWQEAGDLLAVMAMGSVSLRPDAKTHQVLTGTRLILNSLDADAPGARESWRFWPETYGQKVKRWPVPIGKDPSEAYQLGLNIRAWVEAGLSE